MSGVWVFKNGINRLIENPGEPSDITRKVLYHVASDEAIMGYDVLERKLGALGWERYYDDPNLMQFRKKSTVDLISLPREFNNFKYENMQDIVTKNPDEFEVRDV